MSPTRPVAAVAHGAPIASASQPSRRKPIGPTPMQTDSTPSMRLRISGGAAFSIMQATLVYLAAPADMRSRVLGLLSMCIGVGPLGFLMLGLLADRIGADHATAATGIAGLIALALTRRWWRWIGT